LKILHPASSVDRQRLFGSDQAGFEPGLGATGNIATAHVLNITVDIRMTSPACTFIFLYIYTYRQYPTAVENYQ